MAIIVKGRNDFNYLPAPSGSHAAVCCDVVDLGEMDNKWQPGKKQPKVRIAFLIDENMDDGTPFLVSSMFTASLHNKATLTKFLESWRGRGFTAEELEGFDLEKLLGVPALLQIVHKEHDGRVYANVQTVMALPKSMTPPVIGPDFVRKKDRVAEGSPDYDSGPEENTLTEDKIPF